MASTTSSDFSHTNSAAKSPAKFTVRDQNRQAYSRPQRTPLKSFLLSYGTPTPGGIAKWPNSYAREELQLAPANPLRLHRHESSGAGAESYAKARPSNPRAELAQSICPGSVCIRPKSL
jgi:hypothetical protein